MNIAWAVARGRSCGRVVKCNSAIGSERLKKSEVTGDQMKEAQSINKSLTALGDVIEAHAGKGGSRSGITLEASIPV